MSKNLNYGNNINLIIVIVYFNKRKYKIRKNNEKGNLCHIIAFYDTSCNVA